MKAHDLIVKPQAHGELEDGDDDGKPEAGALHDAATRERTTQRDGSDFAPLGRHILELGNEPGEDFRDHRELHEGMDDDTLLDTCVLAVIALRLGIDLRKGNLAIAKESANERLSDHDGLHALDVDALKRVLQKAILDLDATLATT